MIASGAIYNAKELYEMGIVHYLGKTGKGLESVEKFMRQHQQSGNGHRALQQVRQRYHPMDYQELLERVEDMDDVVWLKRARRKPLHYRPLEEYLANRNRK